MTSRQLLSSLRKSPYAHLIHAQENEYVLFNSLTLEAFQVDNELAATFEGFDSRSQTFKDPTAISFLRERGFLATAEEVADYRAAADDVHTPPEDATINAYRIVLTEKCNLACSYCFEGKASLRESHMTRDTLASVLEALSRRHPTGSVFLHWFGGEPLLVFELLKLGVERAHAIFGSGVRAFHSLTTHGGLVTTEKATFLSSHAFTVFVSLDGTREINDRKRLTARGTSTYDDAVGGYYVLKAAGVNSGFLLTPHGDTVEHLFSSVRHVVEDLGCRRVGVNAPQPTSHGWEVSGKILADQLLRVAYYCARNGVELVAPNQRIIRGIRRREPQVHDCRTADGSMAVSIGPSGAVGYCIVSWKDRRHSGDIRDAATFEEARLWKTRSHLTEECRTCVAEMVCGGPCALEAQLGRLDPSRCEFYRSSIVDLLAGRGES